MTVCTAIGRMLPTGVVVTVGLTAAMGAEEGGGWMDCGPPSPDAVCVFRPPPPPPPPPPLHSFWMVASCFLVSVSYLDCSRPSRSCRASASEQRRSFSALTSSSSLPTCRGGYWREYSIGLLCQLGVQNVSSKTQRGNKKHEELPYEIRTRVRSR